MVINDGDCSGVVFRNILRERSGNNMDYLFFKSKLAVHYFTKGRPKCCLVRPVNLFFKEGKCNLLTMVDLNVIIPNFKVGHCN